MKKVSDLITAGPSGVSKRPSKRKDQAEPSTRPKKKTPAAHTTTVTASRGSPVIITGEGSRTSSIPAGVGRTSAIPVGVPIRGITIAAPPRGRGTTAFPVVPVTGSSLFNLHNVPSQEAGEDKRHSGAQWCPEWELNVNDRCQNPLVAQELLIHSVLPRDNTYARKLTPGELMQSASVSWASTTAFFAELTQRYTRLVENYQPSSELEKKVTELEEKLKATEQERDKAEAAREQVEATKNSLMTALAEEKDRRA